jgi:hypothetical protein
MSVAPPGYLPFTPQTRNTRPPLLLMPRRATMAPCSRLAMGLLALAVLAIPALAQTGAPACPAASRGQCAELRQGHILSWAVENVTNANPTIVFTLEAAGATWGWLGLAISESGGMRGA